MRFKLRRGALPKGEMIKLAEKRQLKRAQAGLRCEASESVGAKEIKPSVPPRLRSWPVEGVQEDGHLGGSQSPEKLFQGEELCTCLCIEEERSRRRRIGSPGVHLFEEAKYCAAPAVI